MNTFFAAAPEIGVALIILGVLGMGALWLLARRDRHRAAAAVEWGAPLHEIVDRVDPLDTGHPVPDIQLADAYVFDEVAAGHAVRLDWSPPSFTQEWTTYGETMRQLGDTQQIQAVPA